MFSSENNREMMVVEEGISRASISLGENPTDIEQHAAEELQKYIKGISGVDLRIFKDGSSKNEWSKAQKRRDNVILIGRPKTNSKIKELCDKGQVKLSCDYPGLDGFIVRTIADKSVDNGYYLVLGGSTDRATLYAVYHFLENVCKCGFFEDGDYIPKKKIISMPNLDIVERPYFPARQSIQGCALFYSMAWWNWNDWKQELDWMAKKKFNIAFYPLDLDPLKSDDPAWQKTWKSLGLKGQGEPNTLTYECRLAKQIIDYARKLGMKVISPGFGGRVPREFKKVYPGCQYLEIRWEDAPANLYLNPSDPMLSKVLSIFTEEYNKIYGTDHIYSISTYGETFPGNTPEENRQIKTNSAKAWVRGIKNADSEAMGYLSGWGFFARPQWSKEEAKDFLDAIPNDMLYVCDIWADENPDYKRLNYFYGKKWGFSILHAFGGDTALHGDLKDIIKRLKDITSDSQAENCQYFYLNPEVIRHNFLYYDLVTKLGWDPRKVNLDNFFRDYAIKRYGEKSAENMIRALRELEKSVYSTNDLTCPHYQFPIGAYNEKIGGYNEEDIKRRFSFIPHLRSALDFALKENERQKSNLFYQTDVLDMLRQYLGELFNYHLVKFKNAFHKNDKESTEKEAEIMKELLNKQALLLSTHKDYCLSTEIEKARKRPGVDCSIDRRIRARVSYLGLLSGCSWDEDPLFLWDYARKDLFELVKFYYHPRVDLYIGTVKNTAKKGLLTFSEAELRKGYVGITRKFIDGPLRIKDEDKYSGTTLEAAKEIFAQTRVSDEDIELIRKNSQR